MNFIGLQVSRHNLYAVELKRQKSGPKELVTYIKSPAPPYSLASESEIDLAAYSNALKDLISEGNFTTRNILVALPESQVFTRVITIPRMSEKELNSAMKWEAGQYIPIPLDEVTFDFQVISGDQQVSTMEVLLVAAPLTLTKKYLKIVEDAGLRIVGMETESIATARSLVGTDPTAPTSMVVMIGDDATDISIVERGVIAFTRSITTGGDALVRVVSQELGIESERAEEYLRSYGLEESALEGKVLNAIKPIFDVIVSEIKRSLAYYVTHIKGSDIQRLILSGRNAKLPGVLAYLAAAVNLEVLLANPWDKITIPEKFNRAELEEVGPEFATALGLALKDI